MWSKVVLLIMMTFMIMSPLLARDDSKYEQIELIISDMNLGHCYLTFFLYLPGNILMAVLHQDFTFCEDVLHNDSLVFEDPNAISTGEFHLKNPVKVEEKWPLAVKEPGYCKEHCLRVALLSEKGEVLILQANKKANEKKEFAVLNLKTGVNTVIEDTETLKDLMAFPFLASSENNTFYVLHGFIIKKFELVEMKHFKLKKFICVKQSEFYWSNFTSTDDESTCAIDIPDYPSWVFQTNKGIIISDMNESTEDLWHRKNVIFIYNKFYDIIRLKLSDLSNSTTMEFRLTKRQFWRNGEPTTPSSTSSTTTTTTSTTSSTISSESSVTVASYLLFWGFCIGVLAVLIVLLLLFLCKYFFATGVDASKGVRGKADNGILKTKQQSKMKMVSSKSQQKSTAPKMLKSSSLSKSKMTLKASSTKPENSLKMSAKGKSSHSVATSRK